MHLLSRGVECSRRRLLTGNFTLIGRLAGLTCVLAGAGIFTGTALGEPAAAKAPRISTVQLSYRGQAQQLPSISPPSRVSGVRLPLIPVRSFSARAASFASGVAVVGLRSSSDAEGIADDYGLAEVTVDLTLRAARVTGSAEALAQLARAAGQDPRLRYVESNVRAEVLHRRNDPLTWEVNGSSGLPFQWWFDRVRLPLALNVAKGAPDILVGVVDSGVSIVPDLQGKIDQRWYFSDQGPDGDDRNGHGTFVTSIIAAQNDDGRGLAGACGACHVITFADTQLFTFSLAVAIRKLVDLHVRVLNFSIGSPTPTYLMRDAFQYAISAGVLVVASAGNESGPVGYPAAWLQGENGQPGWGLAVGASDASDARASYSNYGSRLSISAPGGDGSCGGGLYGAAVPNISSWVCAPLTHASSGGMYGAGSGTSFSAPIVAGIAALTLSTRPELKNYELAALLEQTARRPPGSGWTPDLGWGIVDAAAAVEYASGQMTSDRVDVLNLSPDSEALPGQPVRFRGEARWKDGVSVDVASATCTAAAGAVAIPYVSASFADGIVSCLVQVPRAASGRLITGTLTVTDSGQVTGSAGFSTRAKSLPEKTKPHAKKPKKRPKPKK